MATRYQANQKDIKMLKDNGVKLVWTSSHANASPRCSPYQGKLYSLDGTSGTNHEELYKEDKRILEHYACYCEDKSVIKKSLLKKEKILTH